MKRLYYFILCLLSACLLLSSCQGKPATNNTPITPNPTPPIKTDDSIWYSEDANVLGRIWLGMTEKEVYDVLNKYNITIVAANPIYEYDEFGAQYESPDSYYRKCIDTEGYQYFWFDENDRLIEICYYRTDSENDEFKTQNGVQRSDKYEDMIKAYGKPYKAITFGSKEYAKKDYMYYLENGTYLHFVYQDISSPIQSIHYCEYPYLFSYDQ